MPEDLIVAKEAEEVDSEVEFTTREEVLSACYYALISLAETTVMTKIDEKRIARIRTRCLRMIDSCIGEYYDEMFEEDD